MVKFTLSFFSVTSKCFNRSLFRDVTFYFIFLVAWGTVGLLAGRMWDPPTVPARPAAAALLSSLGADGSQGL